jgi:nitrite reductase (NO-forming)
MAATQSAKAVPAGAPGRVVAVRRQAKATLATALAFAAAAPVAAVVPHDTGRWLPLHLFLAGALLLAVSGATQFFAVTWSAGPSPTDRLARTQRLLLAAGAAGVVAAREGGFGPGVVVSGGAVLVALILLGRSLLGTVRPAVQRRFDAALGWYLAALVLGAAGIGLGTALGAGAVTGPAARRARDAHAVLNLLGLVGLVIAGTLPFFVATQAKMRMSKRRERQGRPRMAMAAGTVVAAIGLLSAAPRIAGAGLALYLAGLAMLVPALPRPGRRQLDWAGPRLLQLGTGLAWWAGALVAATMSALAGRPPLPPSVLLALVVGGYAQILAASLAYLGPVLSAGGHERLARGFATTGSWPGLVSGNAAAAALVAGGSWERAAVLVIGAWVADVVGRELVQRRGR